MPYYHATPIRNLRSILKNGLKIGSSRTTEWPYEGSGIFLASDPTDAALIISGPKSTFRKIVVLEVDGTDLDIIKDPNTRSEGFWLCLDDIPPSRLRVYPIRFIVSQEGIVDEYRE